MGKELRQFLFLLLLSWLVSSSQFSLVNRKLLQDDGQDPAPRGAGGGGDLMEEEDDDVLEEDPPNQQLREEPVLQEEPTLPISTDNTVEEEEEEPIRNNQDNSAPPTRSRRPQVPERVEEDDPGGPSLVGGGGGGVINEGESSLPLGNNEDSVLEETIDETSPLDCNGPEDCQNANGVLNTFFRRCSGFYDEQCCIALRAAGAGRVSPCW